MCGGPQKSAPSLDFHHKGGHMRLYHPHDTLVYGVIHAMEGVLGLVGHALTIPLD